MKWTLLFASFLLILSCEESTIEADPEILGKEYFPVVKGKYVTYKFDSIVFDDQGSKKDTLTGFLKYEIGESFINSQGNTVQKLFKYYKKLESSPWTLTDVESISIVDGKVIVTEENLPFIKMVFPNEKGTKWDGNALFNDDITVTIAGEPMRIYQDWEYKVTSKGKPATINGKVFEQCIEIELVDEESALEKRYVTEIYAKGIGLVKREMKIYDTQKFNPSKPWETFAESGFNLVQTVIEHN